MMLTSLPPSEADLWCGQCPASASLQAAVPRRAKNPAQLWGDAAHWVAAMELKTGEIPPEGMVLENGVVVDEEMLQAVDTYVEFVLPLSAHLGAHIEEELPPARSVHPANRGRCDFWSLTIEGDGLRLHVVDFKAGHRWVDAFRNWQLIDYAVLILSLPEFVGLHIVGVSLSVVQPRAYRGNGPVQTWSTTVQELAEYVSILAAAASLAVSVAPPAKTGPECINCRARHTCSLLSKAADSIADLAGEAQTEALPAGALGIELRNLQKAKAVLDARVAGLEEQALDTIRRGEQVPFYSAGTTAGREEWENPAAAVEMARALGLEGCVKVSPVTPKQARDKGMDPAVVAALSSRSAGKVKLIPVDGKDAARVFGRK